MQAPVLGLAVAETPEECAAAVADEIATILRSGTVRDKATGTCAPSERRRHRHSVPVALEPSGVRARAEPAGHPTYVYKGLGFFDADEIKDVVALSPLPLADPSSSLRAAAFMRSRFVRLSDLALVRLAPRLAAALIGETEKAGSGGPGSGRPDGTPDPRTPDSLIPDLPDDEDRRVLGSGATFREAMGWHLRIACRRPSCSSRILEETGYAFELGGARRRQAWENLKKIRALVRRIQNSGYATLPRVAEHLLSLTAAATSRTPFIEALDSVNLMTVHAAKGLEFPILFVVNLAKGASGPPKPVRVSVDTHEEPSVSVGPFISDTDEAERERERHETRRLVYVAVTRARDSTLSVHHAQGRSVRAWAGQSGRGVARFLQDPHRRSGHDLPRSRHV
jgi:ATP-dependent exoDNAse (exonuclease V) beta subunit